MAQIKENPVGALLKTLGSILNDERKPDGSIFHWLNPGIPYGLKNFKFITKPADNVDDTVAFANLANFTLRSEKAGEITASATMIWDIYKRVLEDSVFRGAELTADQKKEIEKKKAELQKKLLKLKPTYTDFEDAYDDKTLAYNALRIGAMTDPNKKRDFALNGAVYKRKVDRAMDDWNGLGQKKEYENITAEINKLNLMTPERWRDELIQKMAVPFSSENSVTGQYTAPANSKAFENKAQWSSITMDSTTLNSLENKNLSSSTQFTESTSGLWFWKSNQSSSSSSLDSRIQKETSAELASLVFDLVELPLIRPWFVPYYLTSGTWDFNTPGTNALSTGGSNPQGEFVGYPVSAIFVKNIGVKIDNTSSFFSQDNKERNSSFSSVGPFRLFGKRENHSSSSRETDEKITAKDFNVQGELKMEGFQLIGFRCSMFGQAIPKK